MRCIKTARGRESISSIHNLIDTIQRESKSASKDITFSKSSWPNHVHILEGISQVEFR